MGKAWKKFRAWLSWHQGKLAVTILALAFVIFYFFDAIFITIPAGHAGVLFRRFQGGTVMDQVYREGLQVILPWNLLTIYNVRIQEQKVYIPVLSQNALTIQVYVSVRYHPNREQVPWLHKTVGPDYVNAIIVPVVTSSVREVVGKYRPEELYTTARHEMQDDIMIEAMEESHGLGIVYDNIIIENIKLPALVNQAIEEKLMLQQRQQAYEFRIKKARLEISRKQLEAQGIRDYHNLIKSSLTPDLLRWLGIQATIELAHSNNAKFVILGDKEGLPLILNLDKSAQDQAPTAGPKLDSEATSITEGVGTEDIPASLGLDSSVMGTPPGAQPKASPSPTAGASAQPQAAPAKPTRALADPSAQATPAPPAGPSTTTVPATPGAAAGPTN